MKKGFKSNQGFTLIELIVVIVIIGIMAAVAGPKFINLQSDARLAVLKGVEGSVRSAMTLVYSKSLIDGTESAAASTVTLSDGTVVNIAYGYPTAVAAGIGAAVDLTGAGDVVFNAGDFEFSTKTTCKITYTAATDVDAPATLEAAADLAVTDC